MNNTIASFSDLNKYRTIPILNTVQNQTINNKLKYNYSNHLNRIESIKSTLYSNSYLQTENISKNKKNVEKKLIGSIKYLGVNKRKKVSDNINIPKFNEDICRKTVNNDFIGKKIILSKYPLINLNKISKNEENKKNIKYLIYNDRKESKTVEINSNYFEKKKGLGNRYPNKGEYFLTKIEKELNDILNKTKTNKHENNTENHKSHFNNKSQNSLFNQNNDSKIKMSNENYFLKDNKIINGNKENLLNKKINRKDLFNQYLNSNIIKRKVLFIDKYNNTLINDNTITLLSDEKDFLTEKYSIQRDDKGNEVNLPLLQRYNKAADQNAKFLTEFNDKLGKQTNTTTEQTQSGSLSQLIKDRFTKQNYKTQKIYGFNPYSENKKDLSRFTMNLFKNQNSSTEKRKNNNPNSLNDILGVIKAQTIGQKNKKKKKKEKKNIKDKVKEKDSDMKKNKKKLKRNLSESNFVSSIYRLLRKFFIDREKDLKSLLNVPINVAMARGKNVKVTLIKKENKIIPINEKGKEIKNQTLLSKFYEEIKLRINSEKQKKLLPKKRLSVNPIKIFVNPIKMDLDNDEDDDKSDLSKSFGENIHNEIFNEPIKTEEKEDKNEKNREITKSSMKKKKTIFLDYPKKIPEVKEQKPKVKIIIKDDRDQSDIYKEEDDFVKDFNFEFYSSDEESGNVSFQKLMRQVRKKINKYLFKLFEFIAKNADMDNFKKDDLTKFLIDKDFRNNFRLLKEQIIKLRELGRDSLDPEGKDKRKKIYIRDSEIINYIYRYIKDENSLFYKSIYKRIKTEKEEEKHLNPDGIYTKLSQMLKENNKDGKKRREFSIYSKRGREFSEDKPLPSRINSKQLNNKKKKTQKDLEFISQDEKKLLILGEINLTNEIRYQISIASDKESKEKFKNLLNKIESLRNLTGDEYVKSLKKKFSMFKDEAEEILKAKEIEERLNGFIDDLNYQRNNLKDKHKYIMSLMYIKDNKFLSYFENEVSE